MSCSREGSPIAVISKFLPLHQDILRFVGFGRLLRGVLRKGDKVTLRNLGKESITTTMEHLYYWMGSKTEEVEEVFPGNIFGFSDNQLNSFKTAYLAEEEMSTLLPVLHERSLIKVRVRSENLQDMPRLVEALKILNRVDPVCEIINDEKGEYILMVNGEIHLERCLKDLEADYFGKKVLVSEFLVDFKETAILQDFLLVKKKAKRKLTIEQQEEEQEEKAEKEDQKKE